VRAKVERADVAAELLPGAPVELLQDLHLLTRERRPQRRRAPQAQADPPPVAAC
jgi:hypothetical protein